MDIYTAFTTGSSAKKFAATVPEGIKAKFDSDILIPVLINTKQITKLGQHYKKFLRANHENLYLTHMFQHGADIANGPHKYVVTSLWALKKDVETFKKLGVPFPEMLMWHNSADDIEVIKKSVKLREFRIEDVHKYIHYANIYLTKDKVYVLHYKGQH